MVSGRDPGELGLYGFRKRMAHSYALELVDAIDMQHRCLWDYATEANKRVVILGVPLTYPPRAVNGVMVSGCLTPDSDSDFTWPTARKAELVDRFGPYIIDVADYRGGNKGKLFDDICRMSRQRFAMATYLWQAEQPDLLMMVDMGPDRFHHAFWDSIDPSHPKYVPNNANAQLGGDYYAMLDGLVGDLLAVTDDNTLVCVVSDHGAQAMHGGFCINDWLIDQGLLVLKHRPENPTVLEPTMVDWHHTQVWAEGGYYSRLFINLEQRECHGIVPHHRYDALRDHVIRELMQVTTSAGQTLRNTIVRPETVYRATHGFAPDLMAIFDDLRYRAIGTVGHHAWCVSSNDQGFDAANHAWNGIFVMAGPGLEAVGERNDLEIYDVTRTVLDAMHITPPQDLLGKTIMSGSKQTAGAI